MTKKSKKAGEVAVTPQKEKILSTKSAMIYGLGIMGIQLSIGLVNSYQAEFFNKYLGAELMVVAALILAAKFISIFADFIIGNLIDRVKLKGGKMRPWVLISIWPLTLFTMLSFVQINFSNDVGRYIYILFITILWNVSMSLADIPSQGMLALLTPDGDEINSTAGISNTLKSIALASPGVFVFIISLLTGNSSSGVGTIDYVITAAVMCSLGLALTLLMYFKSKENVNSTNVESVNGISTNASMSFKEMFRELKNNKMLIIVFITFILGFGRTIGLSIAVQASTILMREGVNLSFIGMGIVRGDQMSFLIGLTSAVSSMIVIVFNAPINKKLGEKKYFISFGIYGFVVSLISFLLYAFAGPIFRTLGAILIYQFLLGPAYAPNAFLPIVMVADIVDYQEWKTGKRTEGTQFAVLSLGNKLSNALSIAIGIFLVGAIGFSSQTYFGIIGAGADITKYVTDDMQTKLWAIYFLLPGLCMLASSIPMLFYKIDKNTKVQMRKELAERRALAVVNNENTNLNDGVVA